MIAYFALHQLGYGDIMLPVPAYDSGEGVSKAALQIADGQLLSHAAIDKQGRVYYDAVSCYDERCHRVKLFSTDVHWITVGDSLTITANEL